MSADSGYNNWVGAGRRASALARIERLAPPLLMLYVALAAISSLFAILGVLYAATRLSSPVVLGSYAFPRCFSLSTIVLVVSSYVLAQAPRLYAADDLATLGRCLGATLLLGSIFTGLQLMGWRELRQQGVLFEGLASGTYVYVLSALHVLHLLAGMGLLLAHLLRVLYADRDAVRHLVFIRNPYHRRQLRIVSTYWHFMGGLWLALFALFLLLY